MRRTNGQKTQMIKTIVGCPVTLRFGVVQDRLRYLSEKDALRPEAAIACTPISRRTNLVSVRLSEPVP